MSAKIYGTLLSANVRKVHAYAKAIGLSFTDVNLDVYAGEGNTPSFLSVNPLGQVPVYEDEAVTIRESNAILMHLFRHTNAEHKHVTTQEESQVLQWLFWESAQWQPMLSDLMGPEVGHRLLPNLIEKPREPVDWTSQKAARLFSFLEQSLQSNYLIGDSLSVADFSVAGMTTYFKVTGFPTAKYPNIKAWLTRMDGHPSWTSTLHSIWQ